MNKTEILGEDRWREIIGACERSGEQIKAFCNRQGLAPSAFYYWRRRLAGSLPSAAASTSIDAALPAFIELKAGVVHAGDPEPPIYEVVLKNGRRISISGAFDERVLGRLLALVEGGAP